MWCAECGWRMERRKDGAWNACCDRLGYWTKEQPLPSDSWWPVTRSGVFVFYPSGKWPAKRKPTAPNVQEQIKDSMANIMGGRW